MSDIQGLIHKTSMDCIEKGQAMERERIIKLLDEQDWLPSIKTHIIELIKGETND